MYLTVCAPDNKPLTKQCCVLLKCPLSNASYESQIKTSIKDHLHVDSLIV